MSTRCAPLEMRALLSVLRAALHRKPVEMDSFGTIDWPVLLELARQHRLLPLLDRFAVEAGIEVPEEIRPNLSREAAENAARNLYMTAELLRVMDALGKRGVQAACYKGPVVSLWAYGELGLRPFSDLDILVSRHQLPLAAATLREHGFRLDHPNSDSDRVLALHTEYHFPYRREQGNLVIELHSRLAPYYFLRGTEADQLLARSVRVSFGFGSTQALCTEDLLLALSVHGAKHGWEWLSMVADIGLLLTKQPNIDWDELLRRSRAIGAGRMVVSSLGLAGALTAVALPNEVIESARSAEVASLIGAAISRWQQASSEPKVLLSPRLHFKSLERARDQLRYAALAVLAPNWNDLEWLLLPRVIFPLYWLLRPVRLLVQRVPPIVRFLWDQRGQPLGPSPSDRATPRTVNSGSVPDSQ